MPDWYKSMGKESYVVEQTDSPSDAAKSLMADYKYISDILKDQGIYDVALFDATTRLLERLPLMGKPKKDHLGHILDRDEDKYLICTQCKAQHDALKEVCPV